MVGAPTLPTAALLLSCAVRPAAASFGADISLLMFLVLPAALCTVCSCFCAIAAYHNVKKSMARRRAHKAANRRVTEPQPAGDNETGGGTCGRAHATQRDTAANGLPLADVAVRREASAASLPLTNAADCERLVQPAASGIMAQAADGQRQWQAGGAGGGYDDPTDPSGRTRLTVFATSMAPSAGEALAPADSLRTIDRTDTSGGGTADGSPALCERGHGDTLL